MRTQLKAFLAVVLAVSLVEAPVFAAPARALGVVLQGEHARVSSGDVASGATLFDGDTLSTESNGALRVRLGQAQFHLLGNSFATVRQGPSGASAELERGTAIFSVLTPEAFELRASDARIRAQSAKPTYAQVTMVGPYELLVTCQRGGLEVRIGDEVHTVPEATSYRVSIEPEAQGSRNRCENRLYLKVGTYKVVSTYDVQGDQVRYYDLQTSAWETVPVAQVDWDATRRWERERQKACAGGGPVVTGRSHWKLLALLLIGVGTGVGIWRATISPDRP